MKYSTLFLLLSLALSACQAPNGGDGSATALGFGEASRYLPTAARLDTGIVNKYYFHFKSADGYEKSTDIRYYHYQRVDEERLSLRIYNAGFELESRFLLRFEAEQMLVEDEIRKYRGETMNVQLAENRLLHWGARDDTLGYRSQTHYAYGVTENVNWQQTSSRDSSLLARPARIFEQQRRRRYEIPEQDDRSYQTQVTDVYVQGFGLFARSYVFEEGTGALELVEQMPLATFEQRRRRVPPRVAYIDPSNTLEAFSNFAICNENGQIYDYYNGEPDAHYTPGKHQLRKLLGEQIDTGLLVGESGYLTFRFVINCEGEAGWFVTEEADLDYQIKHFPEALVTHLFEIVRSLDDWTPTKVREETVDAYAYLTFKLKDGELVEILP